MTALHFLIRPARGWLCGVLLSLLSAGGAHAEISASLPSSESGGASPIDPPQAPLEESSRQIWDAAIRAGREHLRISLAERRLWLMDGERALFSAPIAIGKSVVLEYEDRVWTFSTPRGERRVLAKERDPIWVPPDWHYVELAALMRWKLREVGAGERIALSDGSQVMIQGNRIGRLLPSGIFVPVPAGEEAVFEKTLFIPPLGSESRKVPGTLGRFKLDLGDAYYLHGTPDESTIGAAVTHGCIRLFDSDLAHLFEVVGVGTPVFIY